MTLALSDLDPLHRVLMGHRDAGVPQAYSGRKAMMGFGASLGRSVPLACRCVSGLGGVAHGFPPTLAPNLVSSFFQGLPGPPGEKGEVGDVGSMVRIRRQSREVRVGSGSWGDIRHKTMLFGDMWGCVQGCFHLSFCVLGVLGIEPQISPSSLTLPICCFIINRCLGDPGQDPPGHLLAGHSCTVSWPHCDVYDTSVSGPHLGWSPELLGCLGRCMHISSSHRVPTELQAHVVPMAPVERR